MLAAQVGQLERRTSAHGGDAEQVALGTVPVQAQRSALGIAAVVEVVERGRVEKAIGLDARHRTEPAERSARPSDLCGLRQRVESPAPHVELPERAAASIETGACRHARNARDLRAVLRRDVASEQFQRFDQVGVDRRGKLPGELVADGHAIDDVGHLIVGTSRMDRAVGVRGKPGKTEQYRFQAPSGAADWQLFDDQPAELGPRAAGLGVQERDSFGGVNGNRFQLGQQLQMDVHAQRQLGAQFHMSARRPEAGPDYPQLISLEGDVREAKRTLIVGGGFPYEARHWVAE